MKTGEIITTINGTIYYYGGIDSTMKYNGENCHFLTTDIHNKNCYFRVTPNPHEWGNICRKHYNNQ